MPQTYATYASFERNLSNRPSDSELTIEVEELGRLHCPPAPKRVGTMLARVLRDVELRLRPEGVQHTHQAFDARVAVLELGSKLTEANDIGEDEVRQVRVVRDQTGRLEKWIGASHPGEKGASWTWQLYPVIEVDFQVRGLLIFN